MTNDWGAFSLRYRRHFENRSSTTSLKTSC
jgi:hypothetical protein